MQGTEVIGNVAHKENSTYDKVSLGILSPVTDFH
jgi:hypothetical protein